LNLNKEILKHTSIYSFALILSKIISFVLLPFYASIFKTSGYGVLGMLEATGDLLAIFVWYTIINALSRFFFDKYVTNKNHVVSTALWIACGVMLFLTIVLLLTGGYVSEILTGSSDYRWVCTISFIAVFLEITSQVGGTYLMMTNRSIMYSTVGVVRMVLGITLNIVLIIGLNWGLMGVVVTSAIGSLTSSIIFNWFAVKKCGLGFDRLLLKKMMSYSLPLIPGNIISFLSRQTERLIIRYTGGLSMLGILEMGYKWAPLMVFLVVNPFFQYWDPKRLDLAEHDPNAGKILGGVLTKFSTVVFFVALVFAINIDAIIHLLTPQGFWKSSNIATIEILSAVITALFNHLNFAFYFKKKTGQFSLIISIISAIKIGLSFMIIKTWGINGAAVSACIAAAAQLIVCTMIGQKLFKINIEYRKLISLAVVCTGLYFMNFLPQIQSIVSILSNSINLHTLLTNCISGLTFADNSYVVKMTNLAAIRQVYIWQMLINTLIAMFYLPFAYALIPETRAIIPLIKQKFFRKKTISKEQHNSNPDS
jgi:O-antigen/teichoic acid export membrane protein